VAATDDELVEFQYLSQKVSDKTASEAELARWRELRSLLARTPVPPPPVPPQPPQVPRQHARAAKKLKVEFAPVSTLSATFTEEVAAGGIKLRVPAHLEPGTAMVVRLELGAPGPLTLSARVAWCKRDGGHYLAGLAFVDLRDDERARIEAWAAVTPPPTTART
jgi:PilZ domain